MGEGTGFGIRLPELEYLAVPHMNYYPYTGFLTLLYVSTLYGGNKNGAYSYDFYES